MNHKLCFTNICGIFISEFWVVYFSTYAHLLYSTSDHAKSYYTSDLLARGYTAAIWTFGLSARPLTCSSRGARSPLAHGSRPQRDAQKLS